MTFKLTSETFGRFATWARRATFAGSFVAAGLLAPSEVHAQGATWSTSAICAINIGQHPQMFGFKTSGPLVSAYTLNGGLTWPKEILWSGSQLTHYAIGCASDGVSQALVVVRDAEGYFHALDRLSGWKETYVTGNFHDARGKSIIVQKVTDQGKTKFVLFSGGENGWINMSVYDDTANPKWSILTPLAPVPGSVSSNVQADLAAYSVNVGPGMRDALVSVFVVDDGGTLWENKGTLTGTRTWRSVSSGYSNAFGFGPSAVASYGSPFGHPGDYFETEYNRRVIVPKRDGSYTAVCKGDVANRFVCGLWNAKTHVKASTAPGCFNPGQPCASSQGAVAMDRFAFLGRWYAGTTDGSSTPPAGWTNYSSYNPDQTATPNTPIAWTALSGTKYGGLFHFTGQNDIGFMNLDLDPKTNIRRVGPPI